jgi:hypothetical protein
MRTIALDDLIYYLAGVLDDPHAYRQGYDVGSDDVLAINQMIDIAAEILGRRHPVKIQIPRALLGTLAPLIDRVSKPRGALKGFVDSLKVDAVGDPNPIRAHLAPCASVLSQAANGRWLANELRPRLLAHTKRGSGALHVRIAE